MLKNILLSVIMVLFISTALFAETFNFMKLSDEVSYYANTDDDFNSLGRTLQIVSINQVKIGLWFQIEFTGDFNWEMAEIPDITYDYYIELGIVKKVWKHFSLNYQRIYGTFVNRPVNQYGIRFAL